MKALKIIGTIVLSIVNIWILYLTFRLCYYVQKDSWESAMLYATFFGICIEFGIIWLFWGMDIIENS